jgi:hypothetical protein
MRFDKYTRHVVEYQRKGQSIKTSLVNEYMLAYNTLSAILPRVGWRNKAMLPDKRQAIQYNVRSSLRFQTDFHILMQF